MLSLLVARALISAVKAARRPLHELRVATDLWAGVARGEERRPISLDLFMTEEQFDRLVNHPDIMQGYEEAALLKRTGAWPKTTNPQ